MPNYFVPPLRTKTAKDRDDEKLEKGNSEHLRSSSDVESASRLQPGNISHPAKITFKLGEKGSGTRALREQCLKTPTLFEDTEFPALQYSIHGSDQTKEAVVWKRPGEIVSDPQFFVSGASRFDVKQGDFGDCWFLSVIANLATNKTLLTQVVPEDQSFGAGYTGKFHFRFWQYGRWVEVVIDDRLPTCAGKLFGLHSTEDDEFWSALLEKAYAKLHGSYKAIEGGSPGDAMEDLTGGVAEHYSHPFPDDLFDVILKAHGKNALLSCGFKKIQDETKAETENLYDNHSYSITKVQWVSKETENGKKIAMVRVRNPWGDDGEWLGAWSDKSPEWQSISEKTKIELEFKSAHDGEFWMCFQDFKDHLRALDICYVNPNTVLESPGEKKWESSVFEGEWVCGVTSGGSKNDIGMFQHNPQYHMTLEEGCTVIVALMQKNRRIQGGKFLFIGLHIIHLKEDPPTTMPKPLDSKYFKGHSSEWIRVTPSSNKYRNRRQVSHHVKLPPGSYCIIPSTLYTDGDGEFLLRVFSEKPHKIEEYHEKLGVDEVDYSTTNKHPDEKWRAKFWQSSGDDWQLDWSELNDTLNYKIIASRLKRPWSHCISEDACRRMVALLDVDRSGKLIYGEVQHFFLDLDNLMSAFRRTCQTIDGDEYLSTFDLRKALNKAGLHVNIHILGRLVRRHATKDKKITLENFIMCAIGIKNMLSTFKERDPLKRNDTKSTLDEWMDKILYLY